MPHLFRLFPQLLADFADPSPAASKCLSEMAMALHYIRASFPAAMIPDGAVAALETALVARLHTDAHLRMVSNGFLLAQCATPYAFLSAGARTSIFFDGLLADLRETDRSLRESTPYRTLERAYLLHRAGAGALPDWHDAPILTDARAAYAFDRDLSYAFTHTVLFCTDFAQTPRPDPFVKTVAMLLAAQAHAATDVDLFWEMCICLLSQDLSAAELAGLSHLIADLAVKAAPVFAAQDLAAHYHPLFVHDILRGLMLQRHRQDIATLTPSHPGPFGPLARLAAALNGKDAAGIVALYATCDPQPALTAMVSDRLAALSDLARHHVLFEREFVAIGGRNDGLYASYQSQIAQLRQTLPPPTPAGAPIPCQQRRMRL